MGKGHTATEVFRALTHWVHTIFIYRIPVCLLTFLLIVAPLRYRYAFAHPEIIVVALCFSSLMGFVYLLNKVTDRVEDAINVRGGPIAASAVHPTFVVSIVCLLLPLVYLVFDPVFLPLYGIVAVLGFYYSHELPFLTKRFRLKQVLFVKNTITGLIFSLPPVGIQIVVLHKAMNDPVIVTSFISLFCIFFTFGMMMDVRDMKGDRVAKIYTIANTFGVRVVQIIGTVLVGAYSLLILPRRVDLLFVLGVIFALAFIWGASPKRGAWFYYTNLSAGILFLFLLGFAS